LESLSEAEELSDSCNGNYRHGDGNDDIPGLEKDMIVTEKHSTNEIDEYNGKEHEDYYDSDYLSRESALSDDGLDDRVHEYSDDEKYNEKEKNPSKDESGESMSDDESEDYDSSDDPVEGCHQSVEEINRKLCYILLRFCYIVKFFCPLITS